MSVLESLTVLLTGLVVVFLVLILLTLLIKGYGSAIHHMTNGKKGGKGKAEKSVNEIKPANNSVAKAIASAPVPAASGIPQEIVAVIAAAVACMDGGASYSVKSIKKAAPAASRNAWNMAGLLENTRPF